MTVTYFSLEGGIFLLIFYYSYRTYDLRYYHVIIIIIGMYLSLSIKNKGKNTKGWTDAIRGNNISKNKRKYLYLEKGLGEKTVFQKNIIIIGKDGKGKGRCDGADSADGLFELKCEW